MTHPRHRQTGGKGKHVFPDKGAAGGQLVTGNGAEHTDTGLTVCTTDGGKHKDKLRV
jgi:hypothetical protein